MPHPSSAFLDPPKSNQPQSRNCERLMELGFVTGKRVALCGEHFEIVSEPFVDGNWVAVRVISQDDPTIQTIRLPVSILLGLTNLLRKT